MAQFRVPNEERNEIEQTYFRTDFAAPTPPEEDEDPIDSELPVDNVNGYKDNQYVIVGQKGNEGAELRQIRVGGVNIGEETLLVDMILFDHRMNDPIISVYYNQRKLYGCETKDGTYVVIPQGVDENDEDIEAVDLEVDIMDGTLLTYTGSTYKFFKATYYNDFTLEESSLDDSEVFSLEKVHYATLEDIRTMAGFAKNPRITHARVSRKRDFAESEVNASLVGRYNLPLAFVDDTVRNIATQLAAGYLMQDEYGDQKDDVPENGDSYVKQARSLLVQIRKGELHLTGADGNLLSERSSAKPLAKPIRSSFPRPYFHVDRSIKQM